jgi:hypothetical protein
MAGEISRCFRIGSCSPSVTGGSIKGSSVTIFRDPLHLPSDIVLPLRFLLMTSWIAYIHSDGANDAIAVVDVNGAHWPKQLVKGADFYMQPAWHPHGDQLAWIEWDHPNMPWDGTRLMLAEVKGTPPQISQPRQIAGSEDIL